MDSYGFTDSFNFEKMYSDSSFFNVFGFGSPKINLIKVSWGLLGPQRTLMAHIFVIGWIHISYVFLVVKSLRHLGYGLKRPHGTCNVRIPIRLKEFGFGEISIYTTIALIT